MAAKSKNNSAPPDDACLEDALASCKCRAAVLRAYENMLSRHSSHAQAFDVACCVYRYHHPQEAASEQIVRAWLDGRSLH